MQNLKNFLIAFGAGIVMFGILAFLVRDTITGHRANNGSVQSSQAQNGEKSENSSDFSDDSPASFTGKTFTAVIGGYDSSKTELDALIFIKADKENKRFVISSIPTNYSTVITSTDPSSGVTVKTNVKLKDYPSKFRSSEKNTKILDAVRAITGMEIDYYAFLDYDAVLKIFEKTSGLYFNVQEDMVYIGNGTEENPEISIKAGEQIMNGNQAIAFMRFAADTDDEKTNFRKRASRQVEFLTSAMTQVLKREPEELVSGIGDVLAKCETNFTVSDFKDNAELILKFSEYSENNVTVTINVSDPIEYSYSQRLFENYK